MKFTRDDIKPGKYIEFMTECGTRIGRVTRVRGKDVSVILAPFGMRGKSKGQRKRIEKEQATGIVHYKKVRRFKESKKSRKHIERGSVLPAVKKPRKFRSGKHFKGGRMI